MTEINWESFDCSVPWSDIPLSDVVDEGRYVLRVRELRVTGSREGKLMVMGLFSIEEGPLDGVSFPIQNFVLGTEDDPLCTQDPNTWKRSFGGRQLNQLLEACNVPRDERSLKGTLARASQARFQAYVTKSVQTTGDYAGTDQNRITRYAPYGQELRLPGQRPASNGPRAQDETTPRAPRSRMRPGSTLDPDAPSDRRTVIQEDDDLPF